MNYTEILAKAFNVPLTEDESKSDASYFANNIMGLNQSSSRNMWDGPLGDLVSSLNREGKSKEASAISNAWDGNVNNLKKKIKELGII